MPTKTEIIQGINSLKVAYPNYNPDPEATAALWSQLFIDLPGETLQAAILALLSEPRAFAPSAGEIRGKALELNARAAGIPDAYQAYDEVCKMPASMEMWRETKEFTEDGTQIIEISVLAFSHPLVEMVARLMGWPKNFPTDMPGVDRGQWVKAYDAELSRYMSDAGRHPMITDYIDSKRPALSGGAPALTAELTKRLTKGTD